jgi:hypothetical protein
VRVGGGDLAVAAGHGGQAEGVDRAHRVHGGQAVQLDAVRGGGAGERVGDGHDRVHYVHGVGAGQRVQGGGVQPGFGGGLPDPPGGRRRARLEETAQHGAVQLAKRAGQALLPAGDAAAGEPDQIGQVSHEISFSSGQIGSGRAA